MPVSRASDEFPSDRAKNAGWDWRIPPHRIYFVVGGIGALLLCLLTPPFEVPDEGQHFYRGFQLSGLQFWGSVQGGVGGTTLPASLPELVEHFLGTRVSHTDRALRPHPWADTWAQLTRPLAPEHQEFVEFTEGVAYMPLGYLPQATAIGLLRLFDASPLAELYAGRLANAIIAVLILTWALRTMPVGREAAMVAALLPMAQFQIASVSQDAVVLSAAFAFTAIGLRAYQNRGWSVRDFALAIIAGTVLCGVKPVYAPLLLLGLPAALPAAGDTDEVRRNKIRLVAYHVIVIVIALAVTRTWMHSTSDFAALPRHGADISRQFAFVAEKPHRFVFILLNTVGTEWYFYLLSAIGVLGWLTLLLPYWLYFLSPAAFLAAALWPSGRLASLGWLAIGWSAALILGCACLVELAMYLVWTPVGGLHIGGVQGRYFLPMLPLAGAMIAAKSWPGRNGTGSGVVYGFVCASVVSMTLATAWSVATAFRLF